MPEKPKRTWRRWFQFRLSTWLVLVGILAWAMATRPYRIWTTLPLLPVRLIGIPADVDVMPRGLDIPYTGPAKWNPTLAWPALALVAFIGWKTFWLIRERRRERWFP